MLGVLPYASGVGWDQAWECCWPSVPRLRGEIREQGMLGQQGPIKDQVDSLCSKESSNNMERNMDIQTSCFGWQKFQFEYLKLIRTFKNHNHPVETSLILTSVLSELDMNQTMHSKKSIVISVVLEV